MTRRATTPTPLTPPGSTPRYRDRIYDDPRHDPYQAKRKYDEPTVCTDCGAIFHRGHWQIGTAAAGAHRATCPACHRIHDKLPAGYLTLEGLYFDEHRDEILGLVRNQAERDRPQHPLNRNPLRQPARNTRGRSAVRHATLKSTCSGQRPRTPRRSSSCRPSIRRIPSA